MRTTARSTAIALFAGMAVGCASMDTAQQRETLVKEATTSRQAWSKADPAIENFAKKGYGYALFPEVGKGGFIIAGGGGNGVVYEQGKHVGYAELVEGSVGLTVGGQKYSELIVFENKAAMDRFKQSELSFGADANAVIAETGVAASAKFVDGVAVFVRPLAGAMVQASLGGQRVKYIPK
jgi:lipid-binding SYLF domain-containing protein